MKEAGIYIHIPFCTRKCLYCDFISFPSKEDVFEDYINSLINEIENTKNLNDYIIKTIFIGGGTPSILPPKYLKLILDKLYKLNLKENIEITIESNPETLSYENLKAYKDMGINRLSIGLQSTNDDLLKKLGRTHNYKDFINAYNNAKSVGFNNINVDLMFGIPNQSLKDFENTLEKVSNLDIKHISAYSLIIEEGTPFYNLYEEDKLNLPSEDTEINMYDYLIKYLIDKGFVQYEISNFCKKGYESVHNSIYWKRENYFGLGLNSHSLIDEERYNNTWDLDKYINANGNISIIRENVEKLDIKSQMEEFMFLGLRLIEGISISEFNNYFKEDIFKVYKSPIEKNLENKLLIKDGDRLYLSNKGIKLSNMVMVDFVF